MQGQRHPEESALARALASGTPDDVDRAVDGVLARLRADGDPTEAIAAGDALQAARRFDALLKLSDAAARIAGPESAGNLWRQAVTGLIELGAILTAERLVRSLLEDPMPDEARGQLLARLGRIAKDRYVESGDPATLATAIGAYVDAYAGGTDPLWTGVNTIALRALAARRGLPPDDGPAVDIDRLFALAVGAPMPRSAWSLATELELRIARGETTDALLPLLTQIFAATDATGFVFGSLARQLHEVWELAPADPLLVMLGQQTLADGRGEVILPADPEGYERAFGAETPIAIDLYQRGLTCARSVGNLMVRATPHGTVFAMRGEDLHASLAGRTVLVTNEHVLPDPTREPDAARPEEMHAEFDAITGVDGPKLTVGGFRAVWRSPREQLDITLLLSDDAGVAKLTPLDLAAGVPAARGGAFVYVIGHPGGHGLALTIRGNDLIDADDVRLHYKAPTAPGSSGSPVFDDEWKLIGVHHKGSDHLPALNGVSGTYPGNEGITVRAVRAALTDRPPGETP